MGKMKTHTLLVLLFMIISVSSIAQTKDGLTYVETQAVADTLILPNRIHLNIVISEDEKRGKYSLEQLENMMEKKLKDLGINTAENLRLNDLSSNFKNYFLKQTDVIKSKSYNLVVENAKIAGSVIRELESINISNIGIAKLENTDVDKIKLILRSRAILIAKSQAETLTKPLNQKVGAAVEISDTKDYGYRDFASLSEVSVTTRKSKEVFEPINIEFKKIKIEMTVFVKFKLE